MLKYIQDYPIFANHYFNVTSMHAESYGRERYVINAHEAMKLTLAAYALGGGQRIRHKDGTLGYAAKAEYLILNLR